MNLHQINQNPSNGLEYSKHAALDLYMVSLVEAIDPAAAQKKLADKVPTFNEACNAVFSLMSDIITTDYALKAEMLQTYMIYARLKPLYFGEDELFSALDVVTERRIGMFLTRYSETFGAIPDKDDYQRYLEDENQKALYHGGQL